MLGMVDEFVILDDVQYTKNDWRNRNRIKTPSGVKWLTVPVSYSIGSLIKDTKVADKRWSVKHWKTLKQNYAKAPCFNDFKDELEEVYNELGGLTYISDINLRMIEFIKDKVGITTRIRDSSEIEKSNAKSRRVLDICLALDAKVYLTGPAAKVYLDENLFEKEGIVVEWMDYSGYPEYNQLYPPFEHHVSILDMMFHLGGEAAHHMKFMKTCG